MGKKRRERRASKHVEESNIKEKPIWEKKPVRALNDLQKKYINSIRNHAITLGTGVAGSGKTYIAASIAAEMLLDTRNHIEKIIIARPNEVEGTKSIGFLKGSLNEKMAPLVAPVINTLKQRLGASHYENLLSKEKIQFLPLEYIKGLSFDNCFVIIDEAEDIEWSILKTLLLRTGKNCRIVIDGDIRQTSISKTSGLQVLWNLMDNNHMPIIHVDFHSWDYCVRSDECRLFGEVFEQYDSPKEEKPKTRTGWHSWKK